MQLWYGDYYYGKGVLHFWDCVGVLNLLAVSSCRYILPSHLAAEDRPVRVAFHCSGRGFLLRVCGFAFAISFLVLCATRMIALQPWSFVFVLFLFCFCLFSFSGIALLTALWLLLPLAAWIFCCWSFRKSTKHVQFCRGERHATSRAARTSDVMRSSVH